MAIVISLFQSFFPKFEYSNGRLETSNLPLETPIPKLEIPIPELETPIPELETPISELETPIPKIGSSNLGIGVSNALLEVSNLPLETSNFGQFCQNLFTTIRYRAISSTKTLSLMGVSKRELAIPRIVTTNERILLTDNNFYTWVKLLF